MPYVYSEGNRSQAPAVSRQNNPNRRIPSLDGNRIHAQAQRGVRITLIEGFPAWGYFVSGQGYAICRANEAADSKVAAPQLSFSDWTASAYRSSYAAEHI